MKEEGATSPSTVATSNGLVVDVKGLRRQFGQGAAVVEAVRGVDLELARGEIVLIMGPSGSGKTTLLSMLGALLRPSEGAIRLGGVEITALTERELPALRAQRIGFIFQDFNLMPSLTARENVEVSLNVMGVRGKEARQRAVHLLRELGLGHRLDFLPAKLSGGENQRVAIARALANDPDLVLADEPTANLDSSIGREVMRRLRDIAKQRGQSVLIVSHDDRIRRVRRSRAVAGGWSVQTYALARERSGLWHGDRPRRGTRPRARRRSRLLVLLRRLPGGVPRRSRDRHGRHGRGGARAMTESGRELARRLRRRWALIELVANAGGALVLLAFLHAFHSAADPHHATEEDVAIGTAQVLVYLTLALPLGWMWSERRRSALWHWLSEDRPADTAERDLVLRAPLQEVAVIAVLWGVAALLFGALQIPESLHLAFEDTLTITLGGVTTCALIYLLIERLLRPVTARALAQVPPAQPVGPSVRARLITAWGLASGVPLLGLALVAVGALGGGFEDAGSLAVAVLILTGAGLVAGAVATVLAARSLADPLTAVRRAQARIRAGDLDVRVAVDDGSEVGLLQAGFNEMAAGLRERERLRDLFGRHVGVDVARRALDAGVALGGEVRDVAALFVDLAGSTAFASRHLPEEVVSLLNRFFAIVVDVAEAHGGWVNKFEGDAALCVFGAPTEQSDAAARALAAGRELGERMRSELPQLDAGIGISAGPAVAGNVGAERRLEYTIIGDPVNEAARLSELAKGRPGRVLASEAALSRASVDEAARWRVGEEAVLRGRAAPTRLAAPIKDLTLEAPVR